MEFKYPSLNKFKTTPPFSILLSDSSIEKSADDDVNKQQNMSEFQFKNFFDEKYCG